MPAVIDPPLQESSRVNTSDTSQRAIAHTSAWSFPPRSNLRSL